MKDAREFYNELYYIYKDKYNEKINSLDTKNRKEFDYKKLRLSVIYSYSSDEEEEQKKISDDKKPTKYDMITLNKWIVNEEENINKELFTKHFKCQSPSEMFKSIYQTKDKEKNNTMVNLIKSGLKDLKGEIKKMSGAEKKIKDPQLVVEIVGDFLKFNKQYQQRKDLKILTTNQMLSTLPISLAQLKAGNNSKKF